MEGLENITDASDWPSPALREFEHKLRCPICQDFFQSTLMLRSCSHNFCSLCIRRSLQSMTECPVCRKLVSTSELESNRLIDEITSTFLMARPEMLAAMKSLKGVIVTQASTTTTDADTATITTARKSERLKSKEKNVIKKPPSELDIPSNFAQCPICLKYFAPEKIQIHVDFCLLSSTGKESDKETISRSEESFMERLPAVRTVKRLNRPVYSLMKDSEIKKLLQDWKLPITGDREVWIRRHSEFTLLYNAECDALQPKPLSRIRHELQEMERTWKRPKVQLDWGQDDFDVHASEYRTR